MQFLHAYWTETAGVAVVMWLEHSCRAFQLYYAAVYPCLPCPEAESLDAISCPSAIDTSHHDIGFSEKPKPNVEGNVSKHRFHFNVGTYILHSPCDNVNFPLAHVACPKQYGTGEIANFHMVEVNYGEMPDPHQHKIFQYLVAQGTAANHHYASVA